VTETSPSPMKPLLRQVAGHRPRAAERLLVKLRSVAREAGHPGRAPLGIQSRMCAARIEDGRSPSSTSDSFNGLLGGALRPPA